MSFTHGFEKTAAIPGPAQIIGTARGTASKVVGEAKKSIKSFVGAQKEKGIQAYRAAKTTSAAKPLATGEGIYNRRAKKMADQGKAPGFSEAKDMAGKAKKQVEERASKMKDTAVKNKKSFAGKHPLLTAGGLYLGARMAMGGGEDKNQQQPQVSGGQY